METLYSTHNACQPGRWHGRCCVLAQLRQHGIASASEVGAAYIEGDGHFSVIGRGAEADASDPERRGDAWLAVVAQISVGPTSVWSNSHSTRNVEPPAKNRCP